MVHCGHDFILDLDTFKEWPHCDADVGVNITLTNTPFMIMAQPNTEHPPVNHITSIVGGGGCFELFFSILYVLKMSKISDKNCVESFGGKFSDLRSVTFLLPVEFRGKWTERLGKLL